jgi:hypothetical protein
MQARHVQKQQRVKGALAIRIAQTQHGLETPGAGLPAKAQMEEAKLAACPDCGSTGGRHLRVCPRH